MSSLTPRLRVLHIVLDLDAGGLQRFVVDLAARTDQIRFDTHVLVVGPIGRNAALLPKHVTLHVGVEQAFWSLLMPSALTEQIRAIRPDVVHTHSGIWYKGSLAARRAGVPWQVHTDHGRPRHPDPLVSRLLDGVASRRTDVVIAVSKALGEYLAARVVSAPSRIRVIPNGIDTDLRAVSDGAVLRRRLDIGACQPVILTVGRFDPIKGYDIMLRAFARLLSEEASTQEAPVLVMAGDGPERAALWHLAERLGITTSVRFPGWVEDVASLYALASIFSLSSWNEGTSMSLLEAMNARLCPVVTDVGGNRAVVGPALYHRLVPAGNVEALAAGWRAALADEDRRRHDSESARTRILELFSLPRAVAGYERAYLREPAE